MMNDSNLEIVEELTKARERVLYVYKTNPMAIHSDNILFFRYILPLYYGARPYWNYNFLCEFIIKNHIHFESYRRTAQKIREEYKEQGLFQRDEAKTKKLEEAFIEFLKGDYPWD